MASSEALFRYDGGKDLQMGRLLWASQTHPKLSDKSLAKDVGALCL